MQLDFKTLSKQLSTLVFEAESAFAGLQPPHWLASRGEGKWTCLQLLGHLIDSAANNHQRFVRAMLQTSLDWPGYEQMGHVVVQNYTGEDPNQLIIFWAAYNRHIAHVIRETPAGKASTPCSIDGAPAMTLSNLVADYIAHLEHHLKQLLAGRELHYSGMPWPPPDPARQWPV